MCKSTLRDSTTSINFVKAKDASSRNNYEGENQAIRSHFIVIPKGSPISLLEYLRLIHDDHKWFFAGMCMFRLVLHAPADALVKKKK